MNKDQYISSIKGVIYLCSCAVNGIAPSKEKVSDYNISHLYEAANRHMITAMTGMALKDAGINDLTFKQAIAAAERKAVILNEEKRKVFAALNSSGIWHIALKGTIIREWYPRFAMRESADCDILFDKVRE